MGKWFEVHVAAYKTCLVEIDPDEFDGDEEAMIDSAQTVAMTEAFSFVDIVETVGNVSAVPDDEDVLESFKRNSDEVYGLGTI